MPQRDGPGSDVADISQAALQHEDLPRPGKSTLVDQLTRGPQARAMHRKLRAMIRSSGSYDEFLEKLNQWADSELAPSHSVRWPNEPPRGRYSLPDNLQVR